MGDQVSKMKLFLEAMKVMSIRRIGRSAWLRPLLVAIFALESLILAVAGGRYGEVTFPNSGAVAAQADFLDGLALLHDFEYPLAAAAFKRAQGTDPDFAMAFWGEAMTFNHPVWMQQDQAAGQAVLAKLGSSPSDRQAKAKTDREKAYLQAVDLLYGEGSKLERDLRYEDAMRKVHERYPEDVDAAAFYGLATLGTAHAGRNTPTYMRAASLLEEAWLDHRRHPGLVHYLIHCYDDPDHAALGLRSARLYGEIAPDAPHALHMTSHIFLALGLWQETVDANVAAIRVSNLQGEAEGKAPAHWGHYATWLGYAYLQLGQLDQARSLLTACQSEVKALSNNESPSKSMDPDRSAAGSFANMRLRYLLDTGDWQSDVIRWDAPRSAGPGAKLDFTLADNLAQIALKHRAEAHDALGRLEGVSREVSQIAGKKPNPDPTERLRPEIMLSETRGLLAELDGDLASAEKLLREATAAEETLPVAFGPPTIDKPTHELLGQFLLRQNRPREARVEFEKALARTPGRRVAKQGLALSAASLPSTPLDSPAESRNPKPEFLAQEYDPICGLPRPH
jgi:tetratricopeptide (TPR) repeat protein